MYSLLLNKFSQINFINIFILIYAFTLSFPSEIKRIVAIIMIIIWITDRNKYDFNLPKTNLFYIFGLFIFYSLISYIWSDSNIQDSLSYIKRYWYYLPIFIIFKYLKKEYFDYTLSSFLFGMLISEIFSYGNFFGFWTIGLGSTSDPTVFMQHTLYGMFLSITAILLILKFIYESDKKVKFIYFIFFMTVSINLLINSGRTGYFTLFITLFIILFTIYRKKLKILILSFSAIFVFLSLAYLLSPNFKNRIHHIENNYLEMINQSNYNTSIGARIGFWIIAANMIKEKPLLGSGIANNINDKNSYIDQNNLQEQFAYNRKLEHFHNNFLEILTQFGIIGFLIFLYLLYLVLKIKIEDPIINIFKISTISVFFLGSLTDMVFYLNDTMFLFSFCVGIILARNKIEHHNKNNILINER